MKIKYFLASLLVVAFSTGCSTKLFNTVHKKQVINKSEKITMKTKKFAFSDMGFYKNSDEYLQLQVYSSGVSVADIKVYHDKDLICVGYKCNNKTWFNENFLSKAYPNSLILDVLSGKPIFNKSLKKPFSENKKTADYDITYRVDESSIYFKDRKNKILIKLQDAR